MLRQEQRAAYAWLSNRLKEYDKLLAPKGSGVEVLVDHDALWGLCRSYVDDIFRYRSYHDAPVPDPARKAAYLCKWLLKLRPVVVQNPSAAADQTYETFALMANEVFALWCVSGMLLVDIQTDIHVSVRELLLYTFRHRSSGEDTFILFFAQLCTQR